MLRGSNKGRLSIIQYLILWLITGILFFSLTANAIALEVTAYSPLIVGRTAADLSGYIGQNPATVAVNFSYGTRADNLSLSTPPRNYDFTQQSGVASYFVSGLTCETTYFYRLNAATGISISQSDVVSFTTNPCVSVTADVLTLDAANITRTSARIQGSVATANAYKQIQYFFEYGFNANYGETTNKVILPSESSIQKSVNKDLYNLVCGTNYHYRLVVVLTALDLTEEILMGNDVVFATLDCPGIDILAVGKLSTTRTTASLTATANSPKNKVDVYFAYGDSSDVTQSSASKSVGPGIFTINEYITDLVCATDYYFAFVINDGGVETRSDTQIFQTGACSSSPTVQTVMPTQLTQNSALLTAVVTANGSATQMHFEWGDSASLGTQTETRSATGGVVGQYIEVSLNGLLCDTEYFVKAFADNESGSAVGNVVSFMTLPCEAVPPSDNPGVAQKDFFVAAGGNHSIALGKSGEVVSWGNNYKSQLGNNVNEIGLVDGIQDDSDKLSTLSGYVDAAAGALHSLLLNENGEIYSFGNNFSGQLGVEINSQIINIIPLPLNADSVINIDAGSDHSVALTAKGFVFAWGDNNFGQLGSPTLAQSFSPRQVEGVSDIKSIITGGDFNIVLKNNGRLQGWGDNQFGQLGNEAIKTQYSVVDINNVEKIIGVSAGGGHALALDETGKVYSWGQNQAGQLGRSEKSIDAMPAYVKSADGLSLLDSVEQIAAGGSHSLALLKDGSVLAWGDNTYGQLGIASSTTKSSVPVQVVDAQSNVLRDVDFIAAGQYFSVAVKSNGEIFTWGDNANGELRGDIDSVGFGQLVDKFNVNISLLKTRFIVDTTSISVNAGDVAQIGVKLSSAPDELVQVSAELSAQSPLYVERDGKLFFSADNWYRQQTLTINTQGVKSSVDTDLKFSATNIETISLPIKVTVVKTKPKEQVIGAFSAPEILALILVFMILLAGSARQKKVLYRKV